MLNAETLTKRELFSAVALLGFFLDKSPFLARHVVEYADAVLAELNKAQSSAQPSAQTVESAPELHEAHAHKATKPTPETAAQKAERLGAAAYRAYIRSVYGCKLHLLPVNMGWGRQPAEVKNHWIRVAQGVLAEEAKDRVS